MLPPDVTTFMVFLVSLVLTALLQFFISYAIAMLAFWLLEISTFIFILFAFEYIASGHLFPLPLLHAISPALEHALFFTPFPYMLYFPIGIYTGEIVGADLLRGMFVQAGWVLIGYMLARFAWRRGIRKYAAFGG